MQGKPYYCRMHLAHREPRRQGLQEGEQVHRLQAALDQPRLRRRPGSPGPRLSGLPPAGPAGPAVASPPVQQRPACARACGLAAARHRNPGAHAPRRGTHGLRPRARARACPGGGPRRSMAGPPVGQQLPRPAPRAAHCPPRPAARPRVHAARIVPAPRLSHRAALAAKLRRLSWQASLLATASRATLCAFPCPRGSTRSLPPPEGAEREPGAARS